MIVMSTQFMLRWVRSYVVIQVCVLYYRNYTKSVSKTWIHLTNTKSYEKHFFFSKLFVPSKSCYPPDILSVYEKKHQTYRHHDFGGGLLHVEGNYSDDLPMGGSIKFSEFVPNLTFNSAIVQGLFLYTQVLIRCQRKKSIHGVRSHDLESNNLSILTTK